jgi:DNA-binding FadR family transcriptional regulator
MLQKDIFNGVYLIGTRIPSERKLADIYGMSRITVRDAVRQLTQFGLLKKIPKSGTYVNNYKNEASISLLMGILQSTSHIDMDVLQSMLEIRKIVEVYLTGKAVQRFDEKDIASFCALIDIMNNNKNNPLILSNADVQIHELIITKGGNLIAKLVFNSIRQLYTYYVDFYYTLNESVKCIEQYGKLFDAAARKDSDYAGFIMEKILIYAETSVMAALHSSVKGNSIDISKMMAT